MHEFGGEWDGWTLRCLERVADQRREGELMGSCLRNIRRPEECDPNLYSIRDPDNLPHCTLSAWRVDTAAEGRRFPLGRAGAAYMVELKRRGWLAGRYACFLGEGRAESVMPAKYQRLLLSFAAEPCESLPPFPIEPADRFDALLVAVYGGLDALDPAVQNIAAALAAPVSVGHQPKRGYSNAREAHRGELLERWAGTSS